MSIERFLDAAGHIDDDLVAEFLAQEQRKKPSVGWRRVKRLWWVPIPAVAACLALAVMVQYLVPLLLQNPFCEPSGADNLVAWSPTIGDNLPVVEVTAKRQGFPFDVDSISHYIPPSFKGYGITEENNGKLRIYLPQQNDYLPIYEHIGNPNPHTTVTEFIQAWLPVAQTLTGITESEYELEYDGPSGTPIDGIFSASIGSLDSEEGIISFSGGAFTALQLFCQSQALRENANFPTIHLNSGLISEWEQSERDQAVLAALADSDAKDYLEAMFNANWSNVSVQYNECEGVTRKIMVSFHEGPTADLSDYPPDMASLATRSVRLSFTIPQTEEEGSLYRLNYLVYIEYVNDAVHYVPIGKARLLSIEEAEALLNEGYVYGLPSLACRICREKLIDVDFTDYDAIGLQYLENRVGHRHWRVPFYAFYKYTHTNEKGQKVYATIYVPAVELTGLEEYFAECTESHYHTVSDEAN